MASVAKSEKENNLRCPYCNFLNPVGFGMCRNCGLYMGLEHSDMRRPEPSVKLDAQLTKEKEPETIKTKDIKKSHKMGAPLKALRSRRLTFWREAISNVTVRI